MEIFAIFGQASKINHVYKDKELYVIKRMYELSKDDTLYKEDGFDPLKQRANIPCFEAKYWELGVLPTDPEIVASIYCSILDYAVKHNRAHLYDNNLSIAQVYKFKREDISIVNRQPATIFRAQYDVYLGQKRYFTPSVSC